VYDEENDIILETSPLQTEKHDVEGRWVWTALSYSQKAGKVTYAIYISEKSLWQFEELSVVKILPVE